MSTWCVPVRQLRGRQRPTLSIQPLLPVRDLREGGGVREYADRLVLDSVFCVLRSGCQWRMLPRDLMPRGAAHRWFTTRRRDGAWDRVHDELRRQVRSGPDMIPSQGRT
ncbi:transposase [Streptomyces niveus]|uniref:transposase n=1 Tax=Streptomyces niveus TaxID=193462 RepID=UPI00342C8ABA